MEIADQSSGSLRYSHHALTVLYATIEQLVCLKTRRKVTAFVGKEPTLYCQSIFYCQSQSPPSRGLSVREFFRCSVSASDLSSSTAFKWQCVNENVECGTAKHSSSSSFAGAATGSDQSSHTVSTPSHETIRATPAEALAVALLVGKVACTSVKTASPRQYILPRSSR